MIGVKQKILLSNSRKFPQLIWTVIRNTMREMKIAHSCINFCSTPHFKIQAPKSAAAASYSVALTPVWSSFLNMKCSSIHLESCQSTGRDDSFCSISAGVYACYRPAIYSMCAFVHVHISKHYHPLNVNDFSLLQKVGEPLMDSI